MLKSLHIEGFRAFRRLDMDDLSRVNLIVGTNNGGKTSILEAVEMLALGARRSSLVNGPKRREEVMPPASEDGHSEADIAHLFHGHCIQIGSQITVSGAGPGGGKSRFACCINSPKDVAVHQETLIASGYDGRLEKAVYLEDQTRTEPLEFRLSSRDGLPMEPAAKSEDVGPGRRPVSFVTSESLGAAEMRRLWDQIALTQEEEELTRTLSIIEPGITRLAFLSDSGRSSGGIVVKVDGIDERLPLGSLGDGIRRLLALSMAVIRSQDGFVLIDEIDTGLHHSVMEKVWEVLIETSVRLNVQFFATTHSQDCVRSLAQLREKSPESFTQVRLHRIEKGQEKTITYTPDEIAAAAREHVEVRGW
ncbi:MAG: AAA family ATPase [Phycisphaerae bacterium]|nr:AAA family ATPase [Phycisphaerae bacterium]